MEDLPNSTNGYTMEEIYGRVYGRATKYDNSSRLKIGHMAKDNDDNWYTREEIQGRVCGRVDNCAMIAITLN